MGLTRGASSAAANSPPNKKVKKVYNTNEQYDPTPMTSYAKRTGHPQVFDPVVPVYPEDCMYGKKGEPTQQMYNHVLGSVCNRLALRENFAECTLETQPDFKVCARVSHDSLLDWYRGYPPSFRMHRRSGIRVSAGSERADQALDNAEQR